MYFTNLLKQTLRDMLQHKTRSILAIFGIVWGTVAVVLLLALGQGFYTASKAGMMSFAQGALLGFVGSTSMPYQGLPTGRAIHLKAADIFLLAKAVPQIKYFSPILTQQKNVTLAYQGQQDSNVRLHGITPDYATLVNFNTGFAGRFINNLDVQQARPVIFIDEAIKKQLFPQDNSVIGKSILLQGIPFTIVGFLPKLPHNTIGMGYANNAMIPYTTYIQVFGNQDVSMFSVMPDYPSQTASLQQSVLQYLAYQFHFNPNDKSALQFFDVTNLLQFFNFFFRTVEIFLGFCGAMTLGVGGVGLANTMYLIVTQRTAEIGLRMALGARDWQIMLQFLLESSLLVFIGCLLGFLLSALGLSILHYMTLPEWLGQPNLSPMVVIATLSVLAIVGLTAGYFPARQAAKMTPMEALSF